MAVTVRELERIRREGGCRMAIYPRLSLRYGGGILSHKQQAEQEENTVNILIGLGGTGIDCIKTIKAAVRERLLPDDPGAAVPEYSHIRFLGVDILGVEQISGKKRKSGRWGSPEKMDVLEEEEIFSLWEPHLRQLLNSPRAIVLRPELRWLNYRELRDDSLDTDDSLIYYRCRQLNRLCFMKRSDKFADKLELMLEEAGKIVLRSTPRLSTLNGHKAVLKSGEVKYYKESQVNIIGTQNPLQSESYLWKNVEADFILDITPYVSLDSTITMTINLSQDEFTATDQDDKYAPPGIATRSFNSIIKVKNREMVLLGGIEKNIRNNSSRGLPFIARVPVLRAIFGKTNKQKTDSRLNIFIRPTIL